MACNKQKETFGNLPKLSSLGSAGAVPAETALYDYIRFFVEVELLKTEEIHKSRKCHFGLACAVCTG